MIYTSAISTASLLWIFADLAALILAIVSLLHYLSLKDKLAQEKTDTHAFVPLYVLAFGSSIFGPVTLALFLGVALVFLLMSLSLKKQNQAASAAASSKPVTAPVAAASVSAEQRGTPVAGVGVQPSMAASTSSAPISVPASSAAVGVIVGSNNGAFAMKEPASAKIPSETNAPAKPIHKDRPYPKGYTYAINLGELLPAYKEGEIVSLESLQAKGLAPKEAKRIKCLGHLPLTKKLVFDVADYSGDAYGVITASGSKILRRGEIKIHG
jgi:hypothetical protein